MTHLSSILAAAALLAAQSVSAQPVMVSKAWVRATVPGQTVAGAYIDITAKQPARLVAARSPVSPDVQIHWMQMDGDVMRMREVAALDLPKNKTVSLKPGGYHLMLMQLKKPIQVGENIPITLVIETQRKKRHTVKVNAVASASDESHDHSHAHH